VSDLNLTREKLENEIEHKKILIFLTEKVIADPPTDNVSQIMLEQALRLKEELSNLEAQLSSIFSERKKESKKKQVVRKKLMKTTKQRKRSHK
jgi:hypothetical protein